MDDILKLKERIQNTIQLGESHFREFKSAFEGRPDNKKPRRTTHICRDIAEAVVSFANADGGDLLIGVEDNGKITGVPHSPDDIQTMLQAPKTHVHTDSNIPILHQSQIEMDDRIVLFFSISKGIQEIFQLPDGRCARRKDSVTEPATFKQINMERQEIKSREFDRQFVDSARVTDLDMSMVQAVAETYLPGLSIERYLQQSGLADFTSGGLRLRKAGVLLFAKNIIDFHPRCQVRVLKVSGNVLKTGNEYNVTSDETVRGNIFELIEKSWENLRPYLAYKTEFGPDAKFEQRYIYPEWACREAMINAIAHRDYSIHNGIEIFIFDDRIEIKSPGALLSTLTVQDLEQLDGAHESRNVYIAKVLRENKFMRELGEGMKRIFNLMEKNELEKPVLYSNSLWFSITFPNRSVFNNEQEKWLSLDPSRKGFPSNA